MKKDLLPRTELPTIVKQTQEQYTGMVSYRPERHTIGYILQGGKFIYEGDSRIKAEKGDMFYLCPGDHYIENIPDEEAPFEQISVFYTPNELINILSHLNTAHKMSINNTHSCKNCKNKSYVVYPGWGAIKTFYDSVDRYFSQGVFKDNDIAQQLKLSELIYLIVSNIDCCIKKLVFESSDAGNNSFEHIIYQNIFKDLTIEELAIKCNRSLTSFKKEFRHVFFDSPHRWLTRQRLMYARLLIISTNKTIASVGDESGFPNTSHFIKLFKKEYGFTPATYRKRHTNNSLQESKKEIALEEVL